VGKQAQFVVVLAVTAFVSYVLWRQMKRVEVAANSATASQLAPPAGGGSIAASVMGLLGAGANLTSAIIGQSSPQTN
jgi:hypothetical protein